MNNSSLIDEVLVEGSEEEAIEALDEEELIDLSQYDVQISHFSKPNNQINFQLISKLQQNQANANKSNNLPQLSHKSSNSTDTKLLTSRTRYTRIAESVERIAYGHQRFILFILLI
jgi:hypothetical protein